MLRSVKIVALVSSVAVLAAAATPAHAAVSRPVLHAPTGFAERIYGDFAFASANQIQFEVATVATGSLTDLGNARLPELLSIPSYRVEADDVDLRIVRPRFVATADPNYGVLEMDFTTRDFEQVGYPVELGTFRKLEVATTIGKSVRVHEALELCWSSLNHCVVTDPVVIFLQSMVQNRQRLIAEGWGPKIVVDRAVDKATCQLAGHRGSTGWSLTWGAYWREYYNAIGTTLVHKDLGSQQSGLRCDSSCRPAPFGVGNTSSCWSTLFWQCSCQNGFSSGTTGGTGKWIAETKCTHAFPPASATVSLSYQNIGTASVTINWSLGGGVDSNGGSFTDTCGFF